MHVPCGGNYLVLKNAISYFNLDTSHFTFQLWNKDKKIGARKPIEKYLNNEIRILSSKLRKRLINEEIFISELFRLQTHGMAWKANSA